MRPSRKDRAVALLIASLTRAQRQALVAAARPEMRLHESSGGLLLEDRRVIAGLVTLDLAKRTSYFEPHRATLTEAGKKVAALLAASERRGTDR